MVTEHLHVFMIQIHLMNSTVTANLLSPTKWGCCTSPTLKSSLSGRICYLGLAHLEIEVTYIMESINYVCKKRLYNTVRSVAAKKNRLWRGGLRLQSRHITRLPIPYDHPQR